jgi:hypothetical protein
VEVRSVETVVDMRHLLASLIVAMLGLFPIRAQALPLSYSFTGTLGGSAYLDLGNGRVDVSGAAFTVTGQTLDDVNVFGWPDAIGIGVFLSTSTYDFGSLGSFTTDIGSDFYTQGRGESISTVGLAEYYPFASEFAGFLISVPTVDEDPRVPFPLGTVTPLATIDHFGLFPVRRLSNSAGQSLVFGGFSKGPLLTITEARIEAVPEPTTLVLVGLGAIGLGLRQKLCQ